MGIEAELKARMHGPDRVRELLRERAAEQRSVYADTYFDTPDRTLTHDGRELRVREIHTDIDAAVTMLTYKGPPVHTPSGSKPETETTVGDADALRAVLTAGHPLLASLVYVPELQETFLEIESIVDSPRMSARHWRPSARYSVSWELTKTTRPPRHTPKLSSLIGTNRRSGTVRLEVEQRLQPQGQSRAVQHRSDTEQHPRHERRAVQRVVPDRQGLASGTQQDLLVRDETGETHRVHPHPFDVCAAGPR